MADEKQKHPNGLHFTESEQKAIQKKLDDIIESLNSFTAKFDTYKEAFSCITADLRGMNLVMSSVNTRLRDVEADLTRPGIMNRPTDFSGRGDKGTVRENLYLQQRQNGTPIQLGEREWALPLPYDLGHYKNKL